MVNFENIDCTGCGACENICPNSCIEMTESEYGFIKPQINIQKCVNCGQCMSVCQALDNDKEQEKTDIVPKCYGAYCKDDKIRACSSSGGLFYVFASKVISENGVVFGAHFDENFQVSHVPATSLDELRSLMGSKYVQSRTQRSYREAKMFLNSGRIVYYTGTPCQIVGLKKYLKCEYKNLITQDIVCHGVPSPMVWSKYLEYKSDNNKKKIKSINFRDKTDGWKKYSVKIEYSSGEKYVKHHGGDLMMNAFIKNMCLRPSCYKCTAKRESVSDITLGDFWGVENVAKELDDDKGTSVLVCNTEKGEQLLSSVADNLVIKGIDHKQVLKYNSSIKKSPRKPENYDVFMNEISEQNFKKTVDKYCKVSLLKRVQKKMKRMIRH